MTFLNSLDKLRHRGRNKWSACCPAHDDKNPSLGITQNDDGSYMMNCFGCGANGQDVFEALGLPLDELFGYRKLDPYQKPSITPLQKEQAQEDKTFLAIYDAAVARKDTITYKDHKRHQLAVNRLKGIATLTNGN